MCFVVIADVRRTFVLNLCIFVRLFQDVVPKIWHPYQSACLIEIMYMATFTLSGRNLSLNRPILLGKKLVAFTTFVLMYSLKLNLSSIVISYRQFVVFSPFVFFVSVILLTLSISLG